MIMANPRPLPLDEPKETACCGFGPPEVGPSKASFGQILEVFFKNSGIQKIPQLLGLKVVVTRSS